MQSNLPFPVKRGKVRDVYDLNDRLLIVATDRISAFDVVMSNGIPDKGKILTAMTVFWLEMISKLEICEHHLISANVKEYPEAIRPFSDEIAGRSMLVKKAKVFPVECVARGYLAGSGWKEYQKSQTVCGIGLPPGLQQCDKLPQLLFTPSTKAKTGHDVNITFEEMVTHLVDDPGTALTLREYTLALYAEAAKYAAERGILLADTKFEFGRLPDGRIILIDEVLTPDSSRFWPESQYEPGRDQPSYDKQFVRNWLEALGWDKKPPAPELRMDVTEGTRLRYIEAYERLTGKVWPFGWNK
jgi:phosphoribosylaminoimidazole-succinocarboxamide synthase